MADPLLRRLMILQRLPEYPRKTSTRNLLSSLQADGLSCSIRTIQRDLEYLSASGLFGIGSDPDSKPIGWYWMKGKRSSDINFMDRSSAVAFALVEPMLTGKLPSSVTAKLSEYFHQAERFLNNDHGWTRKVFVAGDDMGLPRDLDNNQLDTICEAMDRGVCLSMEFGRYYKGIDLNFVAVNEVHPLALITKANTVYLVHYKGNHRKASMAPVHHLRNLQILDKAICAEAAGFDVNDYARRMQVHRIFEKAVSYELRVSIKTARYLKENPLAESQSVELLEDGSCIVTFVADDTSYLRNRLKSLGSYQLIDH